MRKQLAACLFTLTMGSAQAATVDLADGMFTPIPETALGDPEIFSETIDGVTFTFSATKNFGGTPRFNNLTTAGIGLHVGGGGGSVLEFTLEVDAAVTLDSYSTVSTGFFLGSPTFGINGNNVASTTNPLPGEPTNLFDGGPLLLDAGTLYTFNIENPGEAVQGFIAGIDFTTVVPLPAPIILLASGLLGVCARRRRRA